MPEPDPAARHSDETRAALDGASTAVRDFARATNQVIAGKTFRIRGTAPALDGLLRALGARPAAAGHVPDLDWRVSDLDRHGPDPDGRVSDLTGHIPDSDGSHRPTLSIDTPVRTDAADRIRWARHHMPVSKGLADALTVDGLVRGRRIGIALVLEPKTAVLALLLRDAGAHVAVYAHADETDDDVAKALRDEGLTVFADSRATLADQRDLATALLDTRPEVLLDDGSHVIRLAHELRHDALTTMVGAAEETTSGLRPLRILHSRGELLVPVVAVNDARTKTSFDNRYGTGQSCVFAILDLLDTLPQATGQGGGAETPERVGAGSRATVAGFGPVGEGTAQVLAALGFDVTVAELDPVRALQAVYAGYDVAPLADAVADAALVVSATGATDTLSLDVLRACRDGAVVAVAGGVEQEVALDDAAAAGATSERIAPKIDRLSLPNGPSILVLDEGGCINITAAEGNPIEIMDLSFAVQLEAVRLLVERGTTLAPGIHPIGAEADRAIATQALEALGVGVAQSIDRSAPTGDERWDARSDPRTTRFGPLRGVDGPTA